MSHSNSKTILTAGFAMFSMFYGSGNLVFPLLMGKETLSNYPYALCGLLLTAVIVPFIGLFGMILYNGDYREYFSKLGTIPAFTLIAMMLCLIGPFGVVPRCLTVAYGGLSLTIPDLSFSLFSILFCVCVGALIWQKNAVIDVIGKILTPFKLGGILFLIAGGLWYGHSPHLSTISELTAFNMGGIAGYEIMDLIAAFFFSSAIVTYLRAHLPSHYERADLMRFSFYASLIGGSLLVGVYTGFMKLGAMYGPFMTSAKPEELLGAVAHVALGKIAVPVITITLAVGCLATAVILTTIFVDFLHKDVSREKLSRPSAIIMSLLVTYSISQLGFAGINRFLGAILEVSYPALIVYALFAIVNKIKPMKYPHILFWGTMALSCIWKFFPFILT